jgi:hypothetical protein
MEMQSVLGVMLAFTSQETVARQTHVHVKMASLQREKIVAPILQKSALRVTKAFNWSLEHATKKKTYRVCVPTVFGLRGINALRRKRIYARAATQDSIRLHKGAL